MNFEIVNGEYLYHSTHNLMHFLYLCYWTGAVNYLYLITGNKWLKQGSIATMAFAMMAFFSTINPIDAKYIFSTDVFKFHSYYLQIVFDIKLYLRNHNRFLYFQLKHKRGGRNKL